jgi:AcrR family transcriptional regulator
MADTDELATTGRGRPRSVEADEAIAQATRELLIEHGYAGLHMAGVAQRAKVSTATLYRRFDNKESLVVAALADSTEEHRVPDTGSLEGDIRALLTNLVDRLTGERAGLAEALVGEAIRNPALAAALRERFYDTYLHDFEGFIDRAVERGEMTPPGDVGVISNLLMGPLYYRWLVAQDPLDDHVVDALVPRLVAALRAS